MREVMPKGIFLHHAHSIETRRRQIDGYRDAMRRRAARLSACEECGRATTAATADRFKGRWLCRACLCGGIDVIQCEDIHRVVGALAWIE
jgi:hypothetical protein